MRLLIACLPNVRCCIAGDLTPFFQVLTAEEKDNLLVGLGELAQTLRCCDSKAEQQNKLPTSEIFEIETIFD